MIIVLREKHFEKHFSWGHLKWGGRWRGWGAAHALLLLLVTQTQCCLQGGVWRRSLISSLCHLPAYLWVLQLQQKSGQATWVHPTGDGVDHSSPYLVEDTLFSLPCFPVHTFGWWVWRDRVRRRAAELTGEFLGPTGTFNPDPGWKASPCSRTAFSSRGFLLALWVISPSLKVLGLGDPNSSCQPPWASWEDDWATESCILFPSSGFHSLYP